jgi:predicted nucleotidyltransferase
MSRDEVLAKLRQHAPELQAEGILHLALFGSTARDEAGPDSDVDLLAEYDPAKRLSLLGICHLENELSDLLGRQVDLCGRNTLRSFARESAEKDEIVAF